MMRRTYSGAVCEGGGTYGIIFPDFPGCVSAGDTMENVLAMGREALQFHIEGTVEDGDAIPEPRAWTIDDVSAAFDDPADPVDDETWVAIVDVGVDVPDYPEMITVAVKSDIVREVAAFLARTGSQTSSRYFIEQAARRELDRLQLAAGKIAA